MAPIRKINRRKTMKKKPMKRGKKIVKKSRKTYKKGGEQDLPGITVNYDGGFFHGKTGIVIDMNTKAMFANDEQGSETVVVEHIRRSRDNEVDNYIITFKVADRDVEKQTLTANAFFTKYKYYTKPIKDEQQNAELNKKYNYYPIINFEAWPKKLI